MSLRLRLAMAVATIACALAATPAYAAIYVAPDPARTDPADVAEGTIMSLVVSLQAGARVPSTSVKIYSTTSGLNVPLRIYDYNMCYTPGITYAYDNAYNDFDQHESFAVMNAHLGEVAATFDSTGYAPAYGRVSRAVGCKNQNLNYTVSTDNLDPDTGFYYGSLNITAASGNAALNGNEILNMFRVQCLSAGCMVGYDAGNSPDRFGMQQSRHARTVSSYLANSGNATVRAQAFSSYDIPFAPPCSMAANQTASVRFLDLDYLNPRVQPERMYTTVYDDTAGAVVPFTSISNMSAGGTAVGFTTTPGGRYNIHGPTGAEIRANFTARPGHKYRLLMDNVFYNNTVRFQLPYDSINSLVTCTAAISRNLIMTPTDPTIVIAGQPINLSYQVSNASAFAGQVYVDYIEWRETNGVNGFGAGDVPIAQALGAAPVNVPPGGPLVVRANTRIAQIGTVGDRFCAAFRIRAVNAATSISTPNYVLRCVSLGKAPYLRAINGDVSSGASFPNIAGNCTVPATRLIRGSTFTFGAVTYGSYGNLGVNSLGAVTTFGSNRNVNGTLSDDLTFANTPSLGTFQTTPRCLNDPFAMFVPLLAPVGSGAPVITVPPAGNMMSNYTSAGARSLTVPTALQKGVKKMLRINGSVRITSNIVYDDAGGYANTAELQQFVLLAEGDIIVDPNVQRLDGIYATKGNFITCSGIATAANLNLNSPCSNQLRVNGAVVTGLATKPFRYFGASNETGMTYADPAELFDLRPDLYLSEFTRTAGSGTIKTVDQHEVPPRF